jgi:hypothetical protein
MPGARPGHRAQVTTDEQPSPVAAIDEGGYDPTGEVDVAGHAGALAACAAALATVVSAAAATGRRGPDAVPVRDLLIGGVAVHTFTRVLSTSSVAAPVRAPFTRFEGAAGSSEHHERPRGHRGVRHTVGELLTCPFCLAVWASSWYVAGLALSHRPTRAWAAVFAVTALSDALQHGYARLRTE